MNKAHLLTSIAETGYNVGFGAKKHFATYDIVQKAPGWIAFVSFVVGVYALVYEPLSNKFVGATVVVLGIAGLYVSLYDAEKSAYNLSGVKLTDLFGRLRDLYRDVQSADEGTDLRNYRTELRTIQSESYDTGISKQILFSDWYAHYKFFWQHQIEWIDEQKQFRLMRDKIPLSFTFMVIVGLVVGLIAAAWVITC